MLVPLTTSGIPITLNNFWNAIYLYHDRPHLINRKLTGSTLLYSFKIQFVNTNNKLNDLINYVSLNYETNKLSEFTKSSLKNLLGDLLQPYDKNVEIVEVSSEEMRNSSEGTFITIKILFPSNLKSTNCVELTVFDFDKHTVMFLAGTVKDKYTLVAPPFPYTFEFNSSGHVKLVIELDDADTPSAEWLGDKLFPKIMKWGEEYDEEAVKNHSLSLIDVERYCELYKELKRKYGKKMIEIWPEKTDPLKFVYEDIAIATYLMCLWERINGNNKPSFVDLGCGNGLLVYILTEEGYSGIGIDVRKRKIWDLYPKNVKLEVKTIIPSESSLFPNTDWIIGNHSDELTPWIPVIAARSSPTTNYFVLPCCSYEFNGNKYIRINPKKSQYNEYLEYIKEISQKCGFQTKIDKMRIPSTKRTCLISFDRNYEPSEYPQINSRITTMIESKCGTNSNKKNWVNNFQPRSETEKVRNCTQLNRDLVKKIVNEVVKILLKEENLIKKWNAGGKLAISDLIKHIDSDDLKELKKECGGLQTLLKNHRYIFEIEKGYARIRVPPLFSAVQKYKSKPCWFLGNHPDGCLNGANDCAYRHE